MRVAEAKVELFSDESMVIAGGIHPSFAQGQEGKLRVTALILKVGRNFASFHAMF